MKKVGTVLLGLILIGFTGDTGNCLETGDCTNKDTFITIKNKNPQRETNIIICVIDESTGKLIPYPIIQLGLPYHTYMGKSCWVCKKGWTINNKPRFETRPSNGIFIYKLGNNPLSGRFDPKRVTSQSKPVKVCIRVYKPNCNYHHEGLATIYLGYDNYFKVFLDCPKRIKLE